MFHKFKKSLTALVSFTFLVGVGGCAEEEQGRILQYEKGVYLGKPDQSLSPEQLQKLVLRSNGQRVY